MHIIRTIANWYYDLPVVDQHITDCIVLGACIIGIVAIIIDCGRRNA